MTLREEMNRDAEAVGAGQGGGIFQFKKSGNYKFRILTKQVALATHFFGAGQPSSTCYGMEKGCPFHGLTGKKTDEGVDEEYPKPSVKFMYLVIDRDDGKVKLAELPWSVVSRIADFEEDEDYKFSEYPMPYDIKIKVDKENTDPKQIYKTEASPVRSDLSAAEVSEFEAYKTNQTPEQYVEKRKKVTLDKHIFDGTWDLAAKKRAESIEKAKANMPKGEALPTIEYPEGPNPADIGF